MHRPKRIGLTMRVDQPCGSGGEGRDALAHDWAKLLDAALPDALWLPLPNVGAAIAHAVTALGLDAIILTGGNDVGSCQRRDETEAHLLRLCVAEGIPLLGVCRGLQMVQTYFGGALGTAAASHHAGRLHSIDVIDARGRRLLGCAQLVAPSYHRFGVTAGALSPELEAWALSEDGLVEVLAHRAARIVAVQWHPERPLPDRTVALRVLRGFCDAR